MNISELSYHLGKLDRRIEEVYDMWMEIPLELRDKIEKLFENEQGVGYHIYRAMENVRAINDNDMEEMYESEHKYYCVCCGNGFDYEPRNGYGACEDCYCPQCDELFENCICEEEE